MRILVLAHRVPYPLNKGEKIRTYHQIEYLCARGHQVLVYAVLHEKEDHAHAAALAEKLDIDVFVEVARFRLLRLLLGLLTSQTLSVRNFRSARLQRRFDASIRQVMPDAILCTGSAMASYIFGNPILKNKTEQEPALLMDFMDLDSDKWNQYRRHSRVPMSLLYRRESWLLSRYERKINARFSSCLFVSHNEVSLFLALGPSKPESIFVVGNGVDTESFHPADVERTSSESRAFAYEAPDMIFTGVMNYLPNEDAVSWFVDNVWTQLREQWPGARFTIAGMSPSERVSRLGRIPGVEVTGRVDSVLPFLHRANIFVAPLRLARGLQNKVLQAFAAGVPAVTSASSAEGIDCVDGEHLLVAETPDEYLRAINRLMREPALYRSIRGNALALVRERYSWQGRNRALLECLPPESDEKPRAS